MNFKKSAYVKTTKQKQKKQVKENGESDVQSIRVQLEIFAEILIDIYLKQENDKRGHYEKG